MNLKTQNEGKFILAIQVAFRLAAYHFNVCNQYKDGNQTKAREFHV